MVYLILNGYCMELLVGAVLAARTKDGHTDMAEKEFEAEAQRSSLPGAAMLSFQRILQPERVEYIFQKGKHIEANETESGDRPRKATLNPREIDSEASNSPTIKGRRKMAQLRVRHGGEGAGRRRVALA